MTKNKKTLLFSLALLVNLLIAVAPVLAVDSLVNTKAAGYAKGDYELSYVREYAIYLAQIILSLVGTVSLIAFVAGGVMFLISGGSQDRIKKGREIITAAVVGLLITFSSVLIINVFLGGLGIDSKGADDAAKWDSNTGAITPLK